MLMHWFFLITFFFHYPSLTPEIAANHHENLVHMPNNVQDNFSLLNNFISFQLAQAQSVVSLKNLIYILRENCIHCYEYNSRLAKLNCLPYFCLPIKEINTFVLSTAVPIKASQLSSESSFSWYTENSHDQEDDDDDSDSNDGQDSEEEVASKRFEHDLIAEERESNMSDSESTESNTRCAVEKRKETLIYILSPSQGIIYEFYPAKNKLKKLPDLLFKHVPAETQILSIKSRLYVTGAISHNDGGVEEGLSHLQIEVFDQETNSWSLFTNKLDNGAMYSALTFEYESERQAVPLRNHYFKLKMPLV